MIFNQNDISSTSMPEISDYSLCDSLNEQMLLAPRSLRNEIRTNFVESQLSTRSAWRAWR